MTARRAVSLLLAALSVAACHPARVAVVLPARPAAPDAVASPPALPEAVPSGGSVGLEACAAARLEVDFARLRDTRRAEWVRRLLVHDARFGDLAVEGAVDPFRDARVVRFCAEVLRTGAWDAIVLTHACDEPSVTRALRVYSTRVDGGGPEALGVLGLEATRVRTGAQAWSAQRVRAGELLLVPGDAARRSAALYRAAAPLDASGLDDPSPTTSAGSLVARLALDEPARRLPWAPELSALRTVRAELRATAAGTAELRAFGDAPDDDAARGLSARLTARFEEAASSLVLRVALRGLLSSVEVRARGATVEVRLPATAPQVDSLLSLIAAAVGARLDGPAEP